MINSKDKSLVSVNAPMTPGEKVKATFKDAEMIASKDGSKNALKFTFENASGSLGHAIWNNYDIQLDSNPEKAKQQQNEKENTIDVLMHLGGALLGKEVLDTITANTGLEYMQKLCYLINQQAKGTEVILHVVVDQKNGYITLPKFRNFIKSEKLMESDWVTDPRYHSYTKPAKDADTEKPKGSMFGGSSTASNTTSSPFSAPQQASGFTDKKDNLPF